MKHECCDSPNAIWRTEHDDERVACELTCRGLAGSNKSVGRTLGGKSDADANSERGAYDESILRAAKAGPRMLTPETTMLTKRKVVMPPSTQSGMVAMTSATLTMMP